MNKFVLLLAEDYESVRKAVKRYLLQTFAMQMHLAAEVIDVENGLIALQIIRKRPDINILITDYAMPEMTGVDLACWTKKIRPNTPIIIHSSNDEPKVHQADIFIPKSDGPDALVGAIRKLCRI